MIAIPKTLKICNNFRLEIIKNSISCIKPELNTDALICLSVKWKVTHVHLQWHSLKFSVEEV